MKQVAIAFCLILSASVARAEFVADPSFQVCQNVTGYFDVAATNDWRARLKTSDASAVAEVSGKWYAEFYEQSLGMRYTNTITYLPTGVMDFATKTCSTFQGYERCTDDSGYGWFTAHRAQDGWIFITRNITSLTRHNACGGGYLRMENGALVDQSGKPWQRLD
jgi:hypothetical protein